MTEDQQQNRQSPKERKSVHDIRNQDLVSRLLAATPPYLYSAPVGPNNFFFSDMLRSLVQARNNENARNIQLQQAAIGRRPRKRSWSQHRPYYEHIKERNNIEDKIQTEKPLELTHKQLFPISAKYSKPEHKDESLPSLISTSATTIKDQTHHTESPITLQTDPSTVTLPSTELVLPPPPPVWYPSLYPPYGIDPLHFFIDLRVSGHIYDRKKENVSPLTNSDNNNIQNNNNNNNNNIENNETIGKHRHGSAFTVPIPRNNECKGSISAINLTTSSSTSSTTATSSMANGYNKYYDIADTKENHPKNTNYVLQNLPKIYTHLTSHDSDDLNYENDNKSDQDIEEIANQHEKDISTHIDVEMLDNVKMKNDQTNRNDHSPNDPIHH